MKKFLPAHRIVLSLVLLVLLAPFARGAENDFSIVALPDPQHYASKYPQAGLAQTAWIKEN
ncbi:hypothetical protein NL529_33700, partial [Klebsiella pneumoniae]|nr:hypothetical protein [Klebsiella pneumoniae]